MCESFLFHDIFSNLELVGLYEAYAISKVIFCKQKFEEDKNNDADNHDLSKKK